MQNELATDDTDVGGALSRLGDSMAELSTSTAGLRDAVEQLQASTERLIDQQAAVSERMSETARILDDESTAPTSVSGSHATPADD